MSNEPSPTPDAPLFRPPPQASTSRIAGATAAKHVGTWRERILARLDERPSTLWELVEHFGTRDNSISGRLTELQKDGYIERTGDRRNHPKSGSPADVWRLRRAMPSSVEIPQLIGAPPSLLIDGDLYDLQPLAKDESYPGLPYARRADTGGLRLAVRVALIECPWCGKPLFFKVEDGKKIAQCGNIPICGRTYTTGTVTEPGRGPTLALVMKTL